MVRNFGREAAACSLAFELEADFAHVFEVKENRVQVRGDHASSRGRVVDGFAYQNRAVSRRLEVAFPAGARLTPGLARMDVVVPPGGQWTATLEFRLVVDGDASRAALRATGPRSSSRCRPPGCGNGRPPPPGCAATTSGVDATFLQSQRDLGALRIFDPEHPQRAVIAAGAPWFMTLFGRDSLHHLAHDAGRRPEPGHRHPSHPGPHAGRTGRRPHRGAARQDPPRECAAGSPRSSMPTRGPCTTARSTPPRCSSCCWVELVSWGAADDVLDAAPAARRPGARLDRASSATGMVTGSSSTSGPPSEGLANQGWKDSFDGVSFASGRLAEAPIALCEVQGYVYAAYLSPGRHRPSARASARSRPSSTSGRGS